MLTYLASFTGWFLGETSQGKAWAQQNPDTAFPWIPDALRSLWHEHAQWLTFHNGLSTPHPWESGPWSWLVDGRPILLWNPQGLTDSAGDQIVRYILMVGTPTLWFAFAPAMLWLVWRIVARRDPAAITVAVGIAAGWLTWFLNLDRTMFIFYMAPALPFFVLAVTLALQDVLGRPGRRPVPPPGRPRRGLPVRRPGRGHVRLLLPGPHRAAAVARRVADADVVPLLVLTRSPYGGATDREDDDADEPPRADRGRRRRLADHPRPPGGRQRPRPGAGRRAGRGLRGPAGADPGGAAAGQRRALLRRRRRAAPSPTPTTPAPSSGSWPTTGTR